MKMLMFIREYQQFCEEFAGFYIHRQPNVNPDSVGMEGQLEERDIFELVYASLFHVAPENHRLLGLFYRRKISPSLMEELQTSDSDRWRSILRFRDSTEPAVTAVQDGIIAITSGKVRQARSYHGETRMGRDSAFFGGVDPLWMMLAFGMATDFSPFDPIGMEQEERQNASSCQTGYVDTSNSHSRRQLMLVIGWRFVGQRFLLVRLGLQRRWRGLKSPQKSVT